jgi:GNAT superfamily N-acetyltransferase
VSVALTQVGVTVQIREYEDDDLADVQRIWQECGWVDEDEAEHLDDFLADADTVVAELEGDAEACTSIHDGSLHHTGTDLPLAVVSSVTTSRVGRKQGLARATLDTALKRAVGRGAAVSMLGMFEQGFYDRSGFGTGAEMLMLRVDPAQLSSDLPYRPPVRLTLDDVPEMVDALHRRQPVHGAVTLPSVAMRRADRSWDDGGFGLGYRDDDGRLTHFLWCSAKGEWGPYDVREWAWQDRDQLLELLGVLRSLGDQVRTLILPEPAQVQLQPLVQQLVRMKITRDTGDHRVLLWASAWWQARILDLQACIAALPPSEELSCNLQVTDPLELDTVAGEWLLRLGPTPTVERGREEGLPDLAISVNSLTRLWLGVRPASTLAATDELDASPELLEALDRVIRLPRPDVQMGF